MDQFHKLIKNGQRGSVLPLALLALVAGGLWAVPALKYADANMKQHRIIDSGVRGTYAAEAGVEDILWYLRNGLTPPADPIMVNGMEVTTTYQGNGGYTLYLGEMVGTSHPDWIGVTASIVQDGPPDNYLFTITVIWQPGSGAPTIHLEEIGSKLPPGYAYVADSATAFGANLSDENPTITEDDVGSYMLNWYFSNPKPSVSDTDPVQTQKFRISGAGSQSWHYEWLVVDRQDVGLIGDITGSLYVITSTARLPGSSEVTGKVVAGVIVNGSDVYVASWQIVR